MTAEDLSDRKRMTEEGDQWPKKNDTSGQGMAEEDFQFLSLSFQMPFVGKEFYGRFTFLIVKN